MADNTVLNPGSGGDTIATDDISGVKFQRVKITTGADGTANDVTNANPVPVSDAGGTLSIDDGGSSITVDGTVGIGLPTYDFDTGAGTDTQPAIGLIRRENGGAVAVGSSSPLPTSLAASSTDGAAGSGNGVVIVAGVDGSNVQAIITDSSGRVIVADGGGTLTVDDGGSSLTVDGTVTVQDGGSTISVDDGGSSLTVDGTVSLTSATFDGDGGLNVHIANPEDLPGGGGGGGGIQYTEADTDSTITGTAIMWEDTSDTLRAVSASKPLPISLSTLPAGTNNIGDVDVLSLPALPAGTNNIGDVDVLSLPAIPAGSNNIGTVNISDNGGSITVDGTVAISAIAGGSITASGQVSLSSTATASAAWSVQMYAAQTTTVQTVKGTGGVLAGYMIYNPNSSVAYVQIFNAATATTVTLGTTTPVMVVPIPPTSAANVTTDVGLGFTNGIKLACTTTATGSSAPSTGLDMTLFYR